MAPEMQQSVRPLLEKALRLSGKDRARFMDEIRREDAEIGHSVASLMRTYYEKTQTVNEVVAAAARPSAAADRAFRENQIVLNRFHIVRFIGRGGMGEVYEAIDLQLGGGRVALKTILGKFAGQDQILRRFKQEVQLALKVTSPNVCRIHGFFPNPDSQIGGIPPFLSMEFLDGETLSDLIDREGPLPLDLVESIALDLCKALDAMHSAGVVHRDFKAHNIMVVPREGPKRAVVTDLGLAHEIFIAANANEDTASVVTRPGAVVGTPPYMAPEQFEGRPVTAATDIYAFGVVLYEMLTGQCPFQADTPIAAAVQRGKHLPPPSSIREGVPRVWDDIVERCLEYEPERRFQSSAEIAAILQKRPPRRWPIIAAVAALLLIAVSFLVWRLWTIPPQPSPAAKRWYERGAADLRDGTWLAATNALAQAVALAPDFALAHASLAHAWAELDFTGKAQQELLRATALEARWNLPAHDRLYLDAVRATLTRDFSSAIHDYSDILHQLPQGEKAAGYIDLGSAYENATNIPEALKCYSEAARFDPESPAAFVHIGILDSHAGKVAEGEKAFARADDLYRAASNLEGIAEIDYQRGYFATVNSNLKAAREFLEQSRRAAEEMKPPSVQLEVRAMARLGVAESDAGNLDRAIETENRAVVLARENGLEYWAIDGLVSLARAWYLKSDQTSAQVPAQQALQLAHESQRPRLEANAGEILAAIRQQQGRWDESVQLAQAALDYYQKTGSAKESVDALIMLGRAKLQRSDLKDALAAGLNAIDPARKSGAPLAIVQAEELVGTALLMLERYPDALGHLQSALDGARAIGEDVEYHVLECAEVLWRLGRYEEASAKLREIPSTAARQPDIESAIETVRAEMALSQARFREAGDFARRALRVRGISPDVGAEADAISATALAALHSEREAERAADDALMQAHNSGNEVSIAETGLMAAGVLLSARSADRARPLAESALHFFSISGQQESQMLALLCLARVAEASGDSSAAAGMASKGMDILSGFQHNWGTSTFEMYVRRNDITWARQQLTALISQRGRS